MIITVEPPAAVITDTEVRRMVFSPQQAQRYSRQFVLREIGVSGQKKLLGAKILVIGAGALGSSALLYLAAAGVGTLGVADHDEVDLSNLQRKIIHASDRVGMEKTASAALSLGALNPDVSVIRHDLRLAPDNILDVIAPYDFIIDATDRFETKLLINDACVLSAKPYSHAGVLRFFGQAMTYVPGQGPCLRCLLDQAPARAETCAQVGVLGAVTGILGSIQATETIKYILGTGQLLVGRMLVVDALSMRFDNIDIQGADPDCRVCGAHASIRSLTENERDYVIGGCGI